MIRNILAIITGVIVGMIVNMGLIILGSILIHTPEGFATMFASAQNCIFPFLVHALGTLVGAFFSC